MRALVTFFFSFYFNTFLLVYYPTLYILPKLYYLKLIMVVMATVTLIIKAASTLKSLFLGSAFGSTPLFTTNMTILLCARFNA